MMMSFGRRARGAGYRACYCHPEAQVGSGAGPTRTSTPPPELDSTTAPESMTRMNTPSDSSPAPDGNAESDNTAT